MLACLVVLCGCEGRSHVVLFGFVALWVEVGVLEFIMLSIDVSHGCSVFVVI